MSFAKGTSVFRTGSSLMEMKQVTLHGTRMDDGEFQNTKGEGLDVGFPVS